MKRSALLLWVLTFAVLMSHHLRADPRWWWDDSFVSDAVGTIADVDIDAVSVYSGNAGSPLFVAWVVPPRGPGGGSLMLTASFDGGCSFCDPVLVTSVTYPDAVKVSIAVAGNFALHYTIQIAYQDNGDVFVAYDNSSVPVDMDPPGIKCEQLQAVSGNVQFKQVNTVPGMALNPDITGDALQGQFTHFYVVWEDDRFDSTTEIMLARDLTGMGDWEEERCLTDNVMDMHFFHEPTVSIDFFTEESPPEHSAVNVAFHGVISRGIPYMYYLRSVDSGDNFSSDGSLPSAPPRPINEPPPGNVQMSPSIDSGSVTAASTVPLWHGVVWGDSPTTEDSYTMEFDAQYNEVPTSSNPPWGDDLEIIPLRGEPLGGPALSIMPRTGGIMGDAPVFLFWENPGLDDPEVYYRGGILGVVSGINLDRYPIPPARSLDPDVSTNLQLTYCDYNELTGGCEAARPPSGGSAHTVASDEDMMAVYVVWLDTREDGTSVWFKRTDLYVSSTPVGLTTECTPPAGARITASWSPLPSCGDNHFIQEKMLRYFVYYRTDPGGPYINTDLMGTEPTIPDTIIVDDDGALPDPVSVDITGLDENTTYYVIVVPEDEARNLYPAAFDPLDSNDPPPQTEESITTPDCEPQEVCLHRAVMDAISPLQPPLDEVFTAPDPRGIRLDPLCPNVEYHYVCPFSSGDPEPEQVLEIGGDPLIYYQVDDARITLEKDRQNLTILFYF